MPEVTVGEYTLPYRVYTGEDVINSLVSMQHTVEWRFDSARATLTEAEMRAEYLSERYERVKITKLVDDE